MEILSWIVVIISLIIIPQIIFNVFTKEKRFYLRMFVLSGVLFLSFIIWLQQQPLVPIKIATYDLTQLNNQYLYAYEETNGTGGIYSSNIQTYKEYEYYIQNNNQIIKKTAYRQSSNIYKTNNKPYVDIYYYKFKNNFLEKHFPMHKNYYDINRWDFYLNN